MGKEQRKRIVVGVDGSEPSKAALRWAVRQAELVGGEVEAVTAWEFPGSYQGWLPEFDDDMFAKAAHATLAKCLEEVAGREPPVEVRSAVVGDSPARALLDAAEGAELLVVGSRGHGAFVGALLGSVSDRCVHHATCPVVVVRS